MEIAEAIEILSPIADVMHLGDPSEVNHAIKLGIEALKEKLEREKKGEKWQRLNNRS